MPAAACCGRTHLVCVQVRYRQQQLVRRAPQPRRSRRQPAAATATNATTINAATSTLLVRVRVRRLAGRRSRRGSHRGGGGGGGGGGALWFTQEVCEAAARVVEHLQAWAHTQTVPLYLVSRWRGKAPVEKHCHARTCTFTRSYTYRTAAHHRPPILHRTMYMRSPLPPPQPPALVSIVCSCCCCCCCGASGAWLWCGWRHALLSCTRWGCCSALSSRTSRRAARSACGPSTQAGRQAGR